MQTQETVITETPIVIRNCTTCGHNHKDRCMVSGYGTMNTRQNIREVCDIKFSSWEPKPVVEKKKHIRWVARARDWITLWK